MPPTQTIPPTPRPWKPTRDQVQAAAMAFARVDRAGWERLPASSREDFLIDGHHALVEAERCRPQGGGEELVYMRRTHAEAYADLLRCVEGIEQAIDATDTIGLRRLNDERRSILERLRGHAAPEG